MLNKSYVAQTCHIFGNYNQAIQIYNEILSIKKNYDIFLSKAISLIYLNNIDSALSVLE